MLGAPTPASQVEFSILGPLEVSINGDRLDLGGQRQQIVLATLALAANRLVPVGRLMNAVYGDDLPSTSRVQVQICISALRRLFGARGHPDTITTRSQGYTLRVDGGTDLQRYEELVARGRQFREARRAELAVGCYRSALAHWRGPALDGLHSGVVRSAANRLDEQRISVAEDCIELELDLGRHRDLIGELAEVVDQHPLRERLHGQLMLALYRSGRQAEALEVYRRARRTLVDELGIEPNGWLRQLEHAILTEDARLNLPAAPSEVAAGGRIQPVAAAVPRLLPADIADFTGRITEVDAIERQLATAVENPAQLAVPVIVASGKPGIGKTTLAVHVSHRMAGRYPDGQLFADLHGQAIGPAEPMQILERFLRVLGVPGASVPDGLERRAEMYRDLLSDRTMLVVLDNAGDEGQILPLLPGTPRSAVLITSRSRLAGLPGAVHVEVDVLYSRHSVELLSRVAGAERVRSEPTGAAELAELCGHLPLALRIAGARLYTRPQWTIGQLVERLENEARRLDELQYGGLGIRASMFLTYDSIGEDARRLFRRLAALDFPSFSGWVAAALLDQPCATGQELLDELTDAHLVDITDVGSGVHSQYRFHDLVRVFARERLAAEEPAPDRSAALERALGALLFLAEEAHRGSYGQYADLRSDARRWPLPERLTRQLVSSPLAWFERERLTIVAGVRQAARAGFVELCWDLAETTVTLFESRAYLNDWRETHQIALDAARQAGDDRGHAVMLYSTGSLHIEERRFDEARRKLELAADLFGSAGDDHAQALAIRNIAFLDRLRGSLDEATARYEQALEFFRSEGDLVNTAYVLHSLAQIKVERDDAGAALRMLAEALDLSRRGGSRRVEAQVLHRLGETYLQLDQPADAVDTFTQALAAVQDTGDPVGEAFARCGLGTAYLRLGKLVEAGAALHSALRSAGATDDRLTEARVLLGLGELDLACGKPRQATVHLHRALEGFRAIDVPPFESRVLGLLAEANAAAAVQVPAPATAPERG